MITREQIAEVATTELRLVLMTRVAKEFGDRIADALMPLVDRIAKERAADEIRAIAHRLDDNGDETIEVALGGSAYVHRVLCDCAHALDGTQ